METAFITNGNGKKQSAIIPIKEYKKLMEMAEEMEEIKAFDKAMKKIKTGKAEFVALEDVLKNLPKH